LSWLYAFSCFDYPWGLAGAPLASRVDAVERRWAYFAGFGLPCALPGLALGFPLGAAAANALFPVFVLVACGSDPDAAHGAPFGGGGFVEGALEGCLGHAFVCIRCTNLMIYVTHTPKQQRAPARPPGPGGCPCLPSRYSRPRPRSAP
jgi:hypothetical protein